MTDRGCGTWLKAAVWPAVVVGATLTIDGAAPLALPLVKGVAVAPLYLLVEEGAPTAPLADLNQALAAARAKLEQLNQATTALAGVASLRAELSAKEEENRRLRTEVQTLQGQRAQWQRDEDAAKAQIAGLGQALDEAAADSKKLEGELADLRWQNAELGTSLGSARAEVDAVRAELGAQVSALMASAEASGGEIERLNRELASRSENLAAATEAERLGAARVAELEQAVAGAKEDLQSLGSRLTASAERLDAANVALAASEQERDAALGGLDEEQARAHRLQGALAVAEADLEQARAANRALETRSASLEQAASVATDAAWQNLRAVESQIAALSSTLAEAELALPADAIGSGAAPSEAASDAAIAPPSEPAAETEARQDGAAEAVAIAPAAGPAGPAQGERALVKLSEPEDRATIGPLAMLTEELPVEGRIQAQSLLADLHAETDPQGLKLIVPGEELFAVNSEEVRNSAHESLAKVAELINLYKDQSIIIIGHTDAVGETDYNQTLSLRRASLVRKFFIDNFDVDADRLATQGMGEQQPIASNATAAGRRANRRVEVLILK
jgi:outer membrane protein OmpA-like peptidoglycan-associated protein